MSNLSITNAFTAGTTIQSSQMNTNFTDITTWANGNIENVNIGPAAAIALSKLAQTSQFLILMAASNSTNGSGTTGDTVPRVTFTSDGGVKFGPGGASALDMLIKREDANTVAVRNAADALYKDFKAAAITGSGVVTGSGFTKTGGAQGAALYVGAAGVVTELAPAANKIVAFNSAATALTTQAVWYTTPGGRLTLTSGVPVTASDVTAAGTLYYTPYSHRLGWFKFGGDWISINEGEISLALAVASGSVYDVFRYATSATATALELLVWTNTTTRATNLAYDADTGFVIKSGDATRIYVGTIYATGANQTEDSAARRMVWNMYNQVPRRLYAADTTNSWTYLTATWRGANGLTSASASGTTNKFDFVIGVAGGAIDAQYTASSGAVTAQTLTSGLAMDSTTVQDAWGRMSLSTSGYRAHVPTRKVYTPAVGYHYIAGLEVGDGANNSTYYGDDGGTPILTHLDGVISN